MPKDNETTTVQELVDWFEGHNLPSVQLRSFLLRGDESLLLSVIEQCNFAKLDHIRQRIKEARNASQRVRITRDGMLRHLILTVKNQQKQQRKRQPAHNFVLNRQTFLFAWQEQTNRLHKRGLLDNAEHDISSCDYRADSNVQRTNQIMYFYFMLLMLPLDPTCIEDLTTLRLARGIFWIDWSSPEAQVVNVMSSKLPSVPSLPASHPTTPPSSPASPPTTPPSSPASPPSSPTSSPASVPTAPPSSPASPPSSPTSSPASVPTAPPSSPSSPITETAPASPTLISIAASAASSAMKRKVVHTPPRRSSNNNNKKRRRNEQALVLVGIPLKQE